MYKLEYQRTALSDMEEIISYISHELKNPCAADRLAHEFVAQAENLRVFPYSNPVYIPLRPLKHEYRKLSVGNFIMFYRTDESKKLITISRVVYSGRNLSETII